MNIYIDRKKEKENRQKFNSELRYEFFDISFFEKAPIKPLKHVQWTKTLLRTVHWELSALKVKPQVWTRLK